MTTTQTEIEQVVLEELFPYEDDGDPNARAHIVDFLSNREKFNMPYGTAKDLVDTARMLDQTIIALCGYEWVPKRNPMNHETCEKCLAIWKGLK